MPRFFVHAYVVGDSIKEVHEKFIYALPNSSVQVEACQSDPTDRVFLATAQIYVTAQSMDEAAAIFDGLHPSLDVDDVSFKEVRNDRS